MRARIASLLLVALFAALPSTAFADEGKGAVSGTVKDQAGAVLRGAEVILTGPDLKDIHTKTDEQGSYIVNDLTPGKYSVKFSYVGFTPLTQTVDVAASRVANADVQLQLAAQAESVSVSGRLGGEAEQINEERSADNVLQTLSSEVIRSLPNANMADALGRMPSVTLERDEGEGKYVQIRGTEPRLTNTTVDGVNLPSPEPGVRQIKFDAIPADIVQEVQVNKTLEANMEGDGIGGSVNLVTKMATDLPSISFSSMGGYTPIIHGRGLAEDSLTVGKRFFGDKLGILVGGSWDWNGRGIDDVEPVPDIATFADGTKQSWKDGTDIREYEYFRSRWGLAGTIDYRIADGSSIYLRYVYSDFKNYGNRWAYTLVDNTPGIQVLNPANVGCPVGANGFTTTPCTAAPTFNTQLRNPDIQLGNLVLGGNHVLNTTWYMWEMSAGRSSYGNSPYSTAVFSSNLATSNCQYDPSATTNVYIPRFTSACFTEGYNPANLNLSNINRDLGHSAQLNLAIAGSGAKRYQIGSRSAVIEYGGKFRNVNKFADTYVVNYNPTVAIPLNTFGNRLTNKNYYLGGDYPLGYNADLTDVLNFANAAPQYFGFSSTQGADPSDFTIIEKVSAGYVMNTIDLTSRLRFIVGLRAEVTNDDVRNLAFGSYPCAAGSCTSVRPNAFNGSYYNLLPSASLRYAVGSDSYLRLVYARALSRPDPQDLAQPLSWTDTGNGADRYSVSFGNANLKAETGDDVDVLFEHYMKTFGMVSAGYFYKALQNPIVSTTSQLVGYQPPGGPLGNYLATQPVNAGSGWVSGFEFNYLQHYSSLPGLLGGLGLWGNYGYTDSRANGIPGRSDHPRLLRTSPNAFNISPTFDKGRVSIRVGMSYNQASIYSYQYTDGLPGGVNGPLSDIYFYSHFQVDAQGSVALNHGLQFVVYGLNLNNEVFGFYQGSPQYMIQREYYQPTVAAGIRWSPKPERR
ncbi:MAG: TonB-dependent receptor [Acidobacteriaceae bacterium]|nr:TonB-dependent receptor [Acidobacteriaceae bacterium]